jgi:hypothetical protein
MPDRDAEQLIADLGARMGIRGLSLGAAGTCQLVFDQRWVVTVAWEGARQRISLNCPLCTPQQLERLPARALRAMLEGNFMGRGSAGAVLSVAPDRRAYLQLPVPLKEAVEGGLHNALELLLNQAETWAARLDAEPGDGPEPAGVRAASVPPAWTLQRV